MTTILGVFTAVRKQLSGIREAAHCDSLKSVCKFDWSALSIGGTVYGRRRVNP